MSCLFLADGVVLPLRYCMGNYTSSNDLPSHSLARIALRPVRDAINGSPALQCRVAVKMVESPVGMTEIAREFQPSLRDYKH